MVTKQPTNSSSDTPSVLKPDPVAQPHSETSGGAPKIEEHPIDMTGVGQSSKAVVGNVAATQPVQQAPSIPTSTPANTPAVNLTSPGVSSVSGQTISSAPMPTSTTPLGTPMPAVDPKAINSNQISLGKDNLINKPVVTSTPTTSSNSNSPGLAKGVSAENKSSQQKDVLTNAAPATAAAATLTTHAVNNNSAGSGVSSVQPVPQNLSSGEVNKEVKTGQAQNVTSAVTPQENASTDKKAMEQQAEKMVKDLDSETKKMKEGKPKEKKPKRKGGGKGKKMAAVGVVMFVLVGLGTFTGLRLLNTNQENRSQAGSIGQGHCESPKGLSVASSSSPGSPGDLGYKPMTKNVTDPGSTYDVSKGEVVTFKTKIENNSNSAQTDLYEFGAQLVQEAPVGTAVDHTTPISEVEMYKIHSGPGTKQTNRFFQPPQQFTVEAKSTKELTVNWTPTMNDCGMYQLDMAVHDFYNTGSAGYCSDDAIVAAGFIRVVGCKELACNQACTSDAECEAANSDWFCNTTHTWSDWGDVTQNVSDAAVPGSSGEISSFSVFVDNGVKKQHLVKGNKIWYRDNEDGWSVWQDVTSNLTKGSGTFTSYKAAIIDGVKKQHYVRGGRIWYRDNANGWGEWKDVTSNVEVASAGSGTITSFSSYQNTNQGGMRKQHLVRDGKIYYRNDAGGWTKWVEVTGNISKSVGSGTIQSFQVKMVDGKVQQHLVRDGKVWHRLGTASAKVCRAKENPEDTNCGPKVECVKQCNSETTSGWDSCNYCDQGNYSSNECLQREIQCRTKGVEATKLAEADYPAPLTGTSSQDRTKWFNWGQAQSKLSCGTACGMGAVCCLPPNEPTHTPTPIPSNTPTPTPEPSQTPLACMELQPQSVSLSLGQQQEFTCSGNPSNRVEYARFEYKLDAGDWQTLATDDVDKMKAKIKVTNAGSYIVRCQVCEGAVEAATCTDWQTL